MKPRKGSISLNSSCFASILPSLMEDYLQNLPSFIISLIALVVCIFIYYLWRPVTTETKSCSVPQVSGALPVIGHLHLFGSNQMMHVTLGALADKYGQAFTIKMGSNRVLVFSSLEMAKECFTVHGKVFATRPAITASKLLGYGCAMFGFAPYGDYWREIRKIATIELLSNHRLDRLKHIRSSELEIAVKELYNLWSSKGCPENGILVDMKKWFGDLSFNMLMRMVVGKRFFGESSGDAQAQYCQKVIRDFIRLLGAPVLSDVIPMLSWFDINGYKKQMKKTAKELDQFLGEWLEEHKQRRLLGEQVKEEQDFMDVMLSILQESNISGFDADTINKATCLNIIAGSHSIEVAITWALCLIVNNAHVLKKAQDELDIHIGKHRKVKESDIQNLVYLQAIVKESLRLYPVSGLITLAAIEDCTLSTGYHVPAGTPLMVNIWKIHRDGRLWPHPDEFQPERFLGSHKDVDVKGQNFELLPFSSGRRSCPAIALALQVLHLTLAVLLHSFEIAAPSNEPVDMSGSIGLTCMKKTPLEVLLIPRLNSKHYEN